MRPPILRWKVALALVGVVVIAVGLGSVLGPTGKTPVARGTHVHGGWTGYVPQGGITHISGPVVMRPRMRREICAGLKAEKAKTPKALRRAFLRSMNGVCKRR